jgi:uncharacterized protein YoxC
MQLLSTSKDILNIAISVSVVAVAFFICWILMYLALSFKKILGIVDDVSKTVKIVKEKAENFTSYFLLIGEGIKKILEYIKDSEGKKRAAKKKPVGSDDGYSDQI